MLISNHYGTKPQNQKHTSNSEISRLSSTKTYELMGILILLSSCKWIKCLDEAQYRVDWTDFNLMAGQYQILNLERFTNVRYAHEFNGRMQYNFSLMISNDTASTDLTFINIFRFQGNTSVKMDYLKYKQGQLNSDQVKKLKETLCDNYENTGMRIPVVNRSIYLFEEIPISKFSNATALCVIDSSSLCLSTSDPVALTTVKYSIEAKLGLTNLDNQYITVFYGSLLVILSIPRNDLFVYHIDLPEHLCV
jgi:hypothetical protein